ncbi:MAG: hydrogenase [Burkholderiaceae bacterium]|nr:hydrogenase [Burkholderiaceae bacterium]
MISSEQLSKLPALVQRLGQAEGSQWVDAAGIDAFLAHGGEQVLFFQGDAIRFPEVLDIAVVLPELCRHFQRSGGPRFQVGLVTRDDEDALARRFAVVHWPSLVFLRDGRWVDTVHGMLDWAVYVERVQQILAKPATRPPLLLQPVSSGASACH